MYRSSSWIVLYTLLLATVGVFLSLQLGALVADVKQPSWNPILGLLELLFGRVKGTWLTYVLLVLTGIGCIVFYALFGESPSDKSLERKNELLGASALAKTATSHNLSRRSRLSGLTIGWLVGTKEKVIQTWESVALYWMGPRMGKTSGFIVRHAIEAPGAYFFTSNKYDGVAEIIAARSNRGTVWIWDTEGLLPFTRKQKKPLMRWDFISAIASKSRAEAYTKILDDSFKLSSAAESISSDSFFDPISKKIVIAALMTARKNQMSVFEMLKMLSENDFDRMISILEEESPLLTLEVNRVAEQHGRTKESILATVGNILTALSNDDVIDWLDTSDAESPEIFNPNNFVRSQDTLIILVKDGGSSAATLSSLLVEAIFDAAADAANPRLDPPLTCDLDEANNTVHLRSLPGRYTYFGSMGIIVSAYFQAFSSGRRLWGETEFNQIRSAATVKVIGGGIDEKELHDLSKVLGTYEKKTNSFSTSRTYGSASRGSTSTSYRKEEIMSPSELSNLKPFTAVTSISGVGRGVVEVVPWFKDEELKKQLSSKDVEAVASYLGYSLNHFDSDSQNLTDEERALKEKKERLSLV